MSGIDWSAAPNWATGHALYVLDGKIHETWLGENYYRWVTNTSQSPFSYGHGLGDERHNPRRNEFSHETLRPAPWLGEGQPPVGTICEWHGANSDGPDGWVYTESQVIAYTEDNLFVVMRKPGCWPVVDRIDNCEFRPIKTAEQIAADERDAEIDEMVSRFPLLDREWSRSVCAALRDAGYRKVDGDA